MKKLLLFLILFSSSVINLNASTEWSDWSENEPTLDNIEIETQDRYKWYIEEKKDLGYKSKDEDICEYFDETDIYVEKRLSLRFPEIKENRIIKAISDLAPKDTKYMKVIRFSDVIADDKISLTEVEIYNNDQKTDYTLVEPYGKYEKIYDNDIKQTAYLMGSGKVSMELDEFYNTDSSDIKIKIYFLNNEIKIESLTVSYTHEKNGSNVAIGTITNIDEKMVCDKDVCYILISLEESVQATNFMIANNLYEYEDTLYKCYKIEKKYLSGYYTFIEDYQKDESSKKTFYRYREKQTEPCINEKITYDKVDITYNKLTEEIEEDILEIEDEINETKNDATSNNKIAMLTNTEETNSKISIKIVIVVAICSILLILTIICMKIKEKIKIRRLN